MFDLSGVQHPRNVSRDALHRQVSHYASQGSASRFKDQLPAGCFFRRMVDRATMPGSGPTSRSIGQPLALCALDHESGPRFVGHAKSNAVVISEVKLRQIPMEVLFLAVLVGAPHPALED